jgi:hypothetical protein
VTRSTVQKAVVVLARQVSERAHGPGRCEAFRAHMGSRFS